jgi:hypothetical protein
LICLRQDRLFQPRRSGYACLLTRRKVIVLHSQNVVNNLLPFLSWLAFVLIHYRRIRECIIS